METQEIVFGVVIPKIEADSVLLKGRVEDPETAMPGAFIRLNSTSLSTQTDFDGNFSLKVPAEALDTPVFLTISYLGYNDLEIPISRETGFIEAKFTEAEIAWMGEVVIVRDWNIFRRIGNLFRRR
tara:strand:- start:108 stop:485 length:378 start_codon:yes stop_codon:yes gene_type:complete